MSVLYCLRTKDVPPGEAWLSPVEQKTLAGLRVPKRRLDYLRGRWAAKQAVLAMCTHPILPCDIAVVPNAKGAPEMFLNGKLAPFGVSISHCQSVALAVVGPCSPAFGADLESIEPRSEPFLTDFFTPHEIAWIRSAPADTASLFVNLCWSAKESTLKALQEGLREDTRAVEVSLPSSSLPAGGERFSFQTTYKPTGEVFWGLAHVMEGQVQTVVSAQSAPDLRVVVPPQTLA
ncbi:MAG: 4'-phosphopantetheinyl transferase superfamily protein [Polyangiaceae bacterium]|nr:4'-phosphopantetheinyl transferase superfamily protein [Polyangiaceae bacterium]